MHTRTAWPPDRRAEAIHDAHRERLHALPLTAGGTIDSPDAPRTRRIAMTDGQSGRPTRSQLRAAPLHVQRKAMRDARAAVAKLAYTVERIAEASIDRPAGRAREHRPTSRPRARRSSTSRDDGSDREPGEGPAAALAGVAA